MIDIHKFRQVPRNASYRFQTAYALYEFYRENDIFVDKTVFKQVIMN